MSIAKRSLYLLIFAALLAACGGKTAAEPATDVNFILTAGIETLIASYFQTQTALYTPPVDTSTPVPLPSDTPLAFPTLASITSSPTQQTIYYTATWGPSFTPSVTGTIFTTTPDPKSLAYKCNNLALVYDVTIPSGTTLKPGEEFTKTWKVENNGTCNWEYPYRFVIVSGDELSGKSKRLGKTIIPGKWTEFSVTLEAPRPEGTYTGYWRLSDAEGNLFGATLSVSIKVRKPQAPTSTSTSLPTSTSTGTPTSTSTPTATSTVEIPAP